MIIAKLSTGNNKGIILYSKCRKSELLEQIAKSSFKAHNQIFEDVSICWEKKYIYGNLLY